MAYTAVALYLAAAAWVITADSFGDIAGSRPLAFFWFVVLAVIAGAGFIVWQLMLRRRAAILEDSGRNVSAVLLATTPQQSALRVPADPHERIRVPHILADEINRRTRIADPWLTSGEVLVLLVVAMFGFLAAFRVWDICELCR